MMLIGGIVLLVGFVLAYSLPLLLWSHPPALRTLAPGESFTASLSIEAGDRLYWTLTIRDYASGDELAMQTYSPSQTPPEEPSPFLRGSSPPGGSGSSLAKESGIYTVVITNTGGRAVTFEYGVTATNFVGGPPEPGVPIAIIGFFIVVGGLGLRFAWRGLRGYWES